MAVWLRKRQILPDALPKIESGFKRKASNQRDFELDEIGSIIPSHPANQITDAIEVT